MGNRLKKFILDLVSFGSPQAIVIDLCFVLILLFLIPTQSLYLLPVRSVFKDFLLPFIFNGNCPETGLFKDCNIYSTGQTRAVSRLLHGDIAGAFEYNRLVFLLLFVMVLLILINLIKSYNYYQKNKKVFPY